MQQSDVYRRETYHFRVPETLVAQTPLPKRDEAKLLQRQRGGAISHHKFLDLPDILPERALLILNESKVIPARLYGKKQTGAEVEIFLLEELSSVPGASTWSCLGRPMKKLRLGSVIRFDDGLEANVVSDPPSAADQVMPVILTFQRDRADFLAWLETNAKMPLPPYIKRPRQKDAFDQLDQQRYQTVYGNKQGSVAAPTAGLHFTDEVLAGLKRKGVEFSKVCLHVGAGTFLPIKADDIREHQMHEERFEVSDQSLLQWLRAKEEGRPIIAVGTTSFRVIEGLNGLANGSFARMQDLCGKVQRTGIFIHPEEGAGRYKSWLCDGIITNFHQPESSLFMLVCALIGIEAAKALYADAVRESYRFYSYGDSSLLWI